MPRAEPVNIDREFIQIMLSTKRSFVTLDGLRGIAAFAVVTRHVNSVNPFFESYLAVDFFFALSGFVLAYAYGERLRGEMSAVDFMKTRLVRLYPLYALALTLPAIDVLRQLFHGQIVSLTTAINFMFAFSFLPSPAAPQMFPLNYPAWSLFFELVANAVFGLMWRRMGGRSLFVIVAIAAVGLTISVLTGTLGFGSGNGAMDAGADWESIGAGFARVAYSFFAGVLIYRMWTLRKPPISVPPVVVVFILFIILTSHPPNQYQAAYDLTVTEMVFPLLIWFGASSTASASAARAFTLLGAASYGVYVLQAPLYHAAVRGLMKVYPNDIRDLGWIWSSSFIVFAFITAHLADRYLDRPIRDLISLRLHRPLAACTRK